MTQQAFFGWEMKRLARGNNQKTFSRADFQGGGAATRFPAHLNA